MSTLCLSDMGELHDEWLREPQPTPPAAVGERAPEAPPRPPVVLLADDQAVAA